MGDEWHIAGGGVPHNASAVFEFGEAWQAFSWNFGWPPALDVVATVEAYLGGSVITVTSGSPPTYLALHTGFAGPGEWAGYLLCGVRRGAPDLLLGRDWVPVPAGRRSGLRPRLQLAPRFRRPDAE